MASSLCLCSNSSGIMHESLVKSPIIKRQLEDCEITLGRSYVFWGFSKFEKCTTEASFFLRCKISFIQLYGGTLCKPREGPSAMKC